MLVCCVVTGSRSFAFVSWTLICLKAPNSHRGKMKTCLIEEKTKQKHFSPQKTAHWSITQMILSPLVSFSNFPSLQDPGISSQIICPPRWGDYGLNFCVCLSAKPQRNLSANKVSRQLLLRLMERFKYGDKWLLDCCKQTIIISAFRLRDKAAGLNYRNGIFQCHAEDKDER